MYKVIQLVFSSIPCQLAELLTILDSFFTSDYIGVISRAGGKQQHDGENTRCMVVLI